MCLGKVFYIQLSLNLSGLLTVLLLDEAAGTYLLSLVESDELGERSSSLTSLSSLPSLDSDVELSHAVMTSP